MSDLFNWSDPTWLFLDRLSMLLGLVTGSITILALLIGYLNRERVRRWLTRNRFPAAGGQLPEHTRYDAIVFTVSKADIPKWVMDICKPGVVGFVETDLSMGIAAELAEYASRHGIKVAGRAHVTDPDDPAQSRMATAHVLTRVKQHSTGVIAVDVTGGKTPMSIGAFMAAEENAADTVYATAEYDASGKPVTSSIQLIPISQPAQ